MCRYQVEREPPLGAPRRRRRRARRDLQGARRRDPRAAAGRALLLRGASRSKRIRIHDLARLLGLTPSAVSHQLRLLRGMRLVRPRRDGRLVYYALDDDHIVKLFEQGLEHVQEQRRRRA